MLVPLLFFCKKENYPENEITLTSHWNTKNYPPMMQKNIDKIRKIANLQIFDERESREFIKNNFEKYILIAYDALIPDAFKSDLFRYCYLYINGGIYFDIKFEPLQDDAFQILIDLAKQQNNILFIQDYFKKNQTCNGFMIILDKHNKVMKDCINEIVNNVRNEYYISSLGVTGPQLLDKVIKKNNMQMYIADKNNTKNINVVYFNEGIVYQHKLFGIYKDYRIEQKNVAKYDGKHYSDLFHEKNIYDQNERIKLQGLPGVYRESTYPPTPLDPYHS